MTTCKFMIIAATLVFGITGTHSLRAYTKRHMTDSSKKQEVFLVQYLAELGDAYDCFFTIEEAWKDGEPVNTMESYSAQSPSRSENLQKNLEKLRQTVPNFTFEIDKGNPRIVHIMDIRLAQQKGYGLERVVKNIDFKGNVNDLVTAIGKQGIPVSQPVLTDTHEGMVRDYMTVVNVKGNDLKVRDALSNFIPLEGRSRIIWIARTKLGPGEISNIQFRGPRKNT